MFKKFFEKRIGKDISKLETARQRGIKVLQANGLSEDEISQIESISYKKAKIAYFDNPNIQATLNTYFASLTKEADDIGYYIP